MAWDKREVIGLLRLEIENIRRRGFGARFRDSVLCLNAGLADTESCEQCILMDFVPPEQRKQPQPCFHIPLDAEGRTLEVLSRQAGRREREQAVLAWLERTLERMQKELAAQRAAAHPP